MKINILIILNAMLAASHALIVLTFAANRNSVGPPFYVAWFFLSLGTVFVLARNAYVLSSRKKREALKVKPDLEENPRK
jgi:hypothetical protein